ncbi:Two component transcriptional regulator, LuxR family [Hyphomicrobium sp. GJ21]|jgi:DNA-binding NarL/FixJ family response regulator|uniref:response regulator transcription factor n=1 Tax=Hyphomicrobium sp. GJ21 TaxID=113574 RepID=UPI000622B70D|nr:response regulator transcription factor [Hyphomicrobium sp. GJ21]CEJ86321.1 Two component transcriptional regulator, LuxR family [Hyphomicrobium sp. GJ21]
MNLLVVESHPIIVLGYRSIFEQNPAVSLYDARTIVEARPMIAKLRPDVIIINAQLPDGSGFDFVRRLTKQRPKLRSLIFSMRDDPYLVMRAIDCGAKGFFSKRSSNDEIRSAVDAVGNGKTWIGEELIQQIAFTRIAQQKYHSHFTRREKNVLSLLLNGCSSTQIAAELNISSTLVSGDCEAMRKKLNARTTAEMLSIAVRSDLNL